jgi:hypothetical protein
MTAPILTHFNAKHQCIVETDTSNFALGAVLTPKEDDNMLHPIPYYSTTFSPAEINYEIHNKNFFLH